MPLPSSINDLSTTAGSNSPAGSESPSTIDDYLRLYASYIAQVRDSAQSNSFNYAAGGGSANAITATFSPAVTTLSDSTVLIVKASAANTDATTFSPNGLTAKPVVGLAHAALQGGEIVANGHVCLQYNTSIGGGSWVLIHSSGGALQVGTATKSQHAVTLSQAPSLATGIAGAALNVRMSVTAASSTATLTADEVIVASALGGLQYRLPSFSKTIDLSTTGAGGMDIGLAPVSGWVALYPIYNPTTLASALLAVNATSVAAPQIYGGVNMPSGYTASALLSVWRTNASRQFSIGYQEDKWHYLVSTLAINTTTQAASLTSASITGNIPLNARFVKASANIASSSSGVLVATQLAASSTGIGLSIMGASNSTAGGGISGEYGIVPILTPQTWFYTATVAAGAMTFNASTTGYQI